MTAMSEVSLLPSPAVLPLRRTGRPSLLDATTRHVLLAAIRAGNRLPAAARYAGIDPGTIYEWLARGRGEHVRPPRPIYVQLVRDVEQAMAEAEIYAMSKVREGFSSDPRLAWRFLEYLSADFRRWREPPEREVPQPVASAPVNQNVILVPDSVLEDLAQARLKAEREELYGPDDPEGLASLIVAPDAED
jgi:hypothetical protein